MGAVERVSVPGTPAGVSRAADAFEQFSAAQGLPDQARWRFLVALDEILSNVVRHGAAGSAAAIDLTFRVDADTARVEVVDTAPPFNPLSMPAPDTTARLEDRRPGGLGITLVQSLMDDVQYEWRDERNHLILTRRLVYADH